MHNKLLITIFITLSFSTVAVYAKETSEIKFEKLPVDVQVSALKHLYLSNITKVKVIQDKGVTKYKIESENNDISKDISFAVNGLVLEIKQGMQYAQLPIAVRQAINNVYPKINITEVESLQEFYFDLKGEVNGKAIEFKVLPLGNIKDEEDKESDKKN